MKHKSDVEIPYVFPMDHHMAPFQDPTWYEPYTNYIGIAREAIEKATEDEEVFY